MATQHNHQGHRRRQKERFRQTRFVGFEPHNILETLLFYSIPQQDTIDIAHELMTRFGSLSAVFDASYEDLLQVNTTGIMYGPSSHPISTTAISNSIPASSSTTPMVNAQ